MNARRIGHGFLVVLPAYVVALAIIPAITQFRDGPGIGGWWPTWDPSGLVDLEVYQRTGALVASGQPFTGLDELPWIYPPFAALLAVPLSWIPFGALAAAWTALCVVLLAAILRRFDLHGWRLSVAALACVLIVEPVRETIGYGQLGIVIVALVVLGEIDGPRYFRERVLPSGWLTGLATAVKLTPAVIAVADFFSGRRKAAWTAFGAFVVASIIGVIALPQASLQYWAGLLHGDTGTNGSLQYYTNQSIIGATTRLSGGVPNPGLSAAALAGSVVVIVLGVLAAIGMSRVGRPALGICLAGISSLVGSPIAWSHHYVWVVPLAVALFGAVRLPAWFRWYGLGYCAWVVLALWRLLPHAGGVEFTYTWWQHAIDDLGVAGGIVLLVLSVVATRGAFRRDSAAGGQAENVRGGRHAGGKSNVSSIVDPGVNP